MILSRLTLLDLPARMNLDRHNWYIVVANFYVSLLSRRERTLLLFKTFIVGSLLLNLPVIRPVKQVEELSSTHYIFIYIYQYCWQWYDWYVLTCYNIVVGSVIIYPISLAVLRVLTCYNVCNDTDTVGLDCCLSVRTSLITCNVNKSRDRKSWDKWRGYTLLTPQQDSKVTNVARIEANEKYFIRPLLCITFIYKIYIK